jgi:PKHD-type hydroxylase
VVDDLYGSHAVKLGAGDLILYPASSLHHVTEVTRGVRTASFFWIQSLVRDDAKRALLLDMDVAIQRLSLTVGAADPSVLP